MRLGLRPKWWNGCCVAIPLLDPPGSHHSARRSGYREGRFILQVRATLDRIAANPFQYQIVSGTRDARRARVHNFPFGLWYRVEPSRAWRIAPIRRWRSDARCNSWIPRDALCR